MPILEINDLSSNEGVYWATVEVFSVLMFPDERDERKRYKAAVAAKHLSVIEREAAGIPLPEEESRIEELPSDPQARTATHHHEKFVLNSFLLASGGYTALADSSAFSDYDELMLKKSADWFTAGMILGCIQRMDAHHRDLRGGASVNKAVYIVEKSRLQPLVRSNSNSIRKAWSKYKKVSHLCASLFDFSILVSSENPDPADFSIAFRTRMHESFEIYISEAEAYLEFGLSFRPSHGRPNTLLDPNETWLLPEERCWIPSIAEPSCLSGHLLEAARSYRAPIPS